MKKILIASAIAASTIMTAPSFAATQGTVGGTSSGDLDITVNVADAVRISGLNDLTATFDGTNDVVLSDSACIYRNGTGLYEITAVGDGGTGTDFSITDGASPAIAYTVNWNDQAVAGAGVPVTSGLAVTGQTGADDSSTTCATTGLNSAVEVTILATDLIAAPSSSYVGTLFLSVSPE